MTLPISQYPDWPARMTADVAAAYMGVSKTKFLLGAGNGSYPAALHDGGNAHWHRVTLDRWLAIQRGESEDDESEWDVYLEHAD